MAIRIASRKRKDNSRFRLAAVIAQGSRVYSFGVNSNKPPGTYPASIHAECAALNRLPIMDGGDIYVARILANGTVAMARPCDACMQAIRSHGIDTIHFTNRNGEWESIELVHEKK